MNPYKLITLFFRGLLWIVTLALLVAVVLPIMEFKSRPFVMKEISMEAGDDSSALEWFLDHNKLQPIDADQPSWIFANDLEGLSSDLVDSIEDNVFIGEMLFNQVGGDLSKRHFLENLTEAEYTGYIGKSFSDLSDRDEVPENIILNFEKSSGAPWEFYGKGLVLSDNEHVVVLLEGSDYNGGVFVETSQGRYEFNGYFELIFENDNTVASFTIPLTENGEMKLGEYVSGSRFAALLSVSNRVYDGYYFAGDFSGIDVRVPKSYSHMPSLMQNKVIYDEKMNESLFWKWYYPTIETLLSDKKDNSLYAEKDGSEDNRFIIEDQSILIANGAEFVPFFMKGVNLGAALPGKTFTEFPQDKKIYYNWLEQMSSLNINTLRVYTLLPPVFYQALYEFNEERTSADQEPIYLLQEIWPEEYPEDHNYLGEDYNAEYRKEIEYAVHAVHGNINIPERQYRAYGLYKYDVSEYLIGYLVGREMEPEEVKATDELNDGYTFKGRYLYSVEGATPTEAWLASSCDYALRMEDLFYSDSPLVAIVSWPTLDPARHDSEWNASAEKSKMYNDSAVVDINRIGINPETVSGFFGAYHIYPNYPDFMNNELSYNEYYDEKGRFRYGGYLQEFMSGHSKYPAVVAEYGISTSQVTAHYSPDGYNHGGLSEELQAEGIIRMTDAIIREGYSGAIIFEWMDEWAKKTWTTEPYMIPYDNNPYWHNILDPEQNYGLLAVESSDPDLESKGPITFGQNEGYIYLTIDALILKEDQNHFSLAIDTINTSDDTPEFLLEIGPVTKLKANPGYNWLGGLYSASEAPFDQYQDLVQVINKENMSMYGDITPEKSINLGSFKYGDFENPTHSVNFDAGKWHIRIPYGLLGISDPTQNKALYDEDKKIPVQRDEIGTVEINEIEFTIIHSGESYRFDLNIWDQPKYKVRLKSGFNAIADYFESID